MKPVCLLLIGLLSVSRTQAAPETVVLQPSVDALDKYASEAWREGRDDMLRIVKLGEERKDLPKRAWVGRDRRDADEDINALLDEVVEKLQGSELLEVRSGYQELGERISGLRSSIRELEEERVTAVTEKHPIEFYKKTRAEYADEIAARKADIATLEDEREALQETFAEAWKQLGLSPSESQVKLMLSSVSGEDVMGISAVFHNVRGLNGELQRFMRENPDDPEAARRYYGIHVVMVRALERAYEHTLANIKERYLTNIAGLEEENDRLRQQTDKLIRRTPETQRDVLLSTQRTQEITAEALDLYRQHLTSLQERVARGLEAIRLRREVAENAYDTLRISTALAEEMQSALREIDTLRGMHLPDPTPLDDERLRKKFDEISAALKER